jgi:hypothetical protein
MHSVKVKRTGLLEKIKANRQGHRDLFLKAQEGYRLDVIAELEQHLQDARDRKKISRSLSLPEPQDHTEDYDSVIAMLEMSVDDTIELDAASFQQYVLDKWSWKRAADLTNAAYASKIPATSLR